MAINRDKPDRWKQDIAASVDMYNAWFLRFAPQTFRATRKQTTVEVEGALGITDNLAKLTPTILRQHPEVLPTLRMATCPPVAVDRLIGLAGVKPGLVKSIENDGKLPARMGDDELGGQLTAICRVLRKLLDKDIFVWLGRQQGPTEAEVYRAATIVADRLCGAVANPIIRNAQEQRQLKAIGMWLERRGYKRVRVGGETRFDTLPAGSFAVHVNVPVRLKDAGKGVNIPADVVIIPKSPGEPPLLIEAKSAGDFANVNKRRKEEAMKMSLLRQTYGDGVRYGLFLCGYFDSGYLGYEAAEGIDWVWEHRIDELEQFGL